MLERWWTSGLEATIRFLTKQTDYQKIVVEARRFDSQEMRLEIDGNILIPKLDNRLELTPIHCQIAT